ncbi:MAG: glycosyltransferase [Winogradskyella sp.]|nr:MAG: glycosyltransferase [Winogradskyella sp.]
MKENKPKVSVIVLAYNHAPFIEENLQSIINQNTNFQYEIILGEDESNDGTREICIDYANKYPDLIKLFLRSRDDVIKLHGVPSGRFNFIESLKVCSGDYVAICEGDDYWIDNLKLQKQVDFLDANENYSFSWTRFKSLKNSTGEFVIDFNEKYFKEGEKYINFDYERFQKGWHIGMQTLLFRNDRDILKNSYDFKYFKDVHIIALSLKKGKGICLNFVSAIYRLHDGGVHTSISEYNGFKIGYLTHKEIYFDNKTNQYLRRKYLHSYNNFLNANIRAGYLPKALWMSIDLLFKNGKIIDFLKHIKRIVVKLFGKK